MHVEDGADVCWGPKGQGWAGECSEPRASGWAGLPLARPTPLGSQFGFIRADAGTRWLFTTYPAPHLPPCAEWPRVFVSTCLLFTTLPSCYHFPHSTDEELEAQGARVGHTSWSGGVGI